MKLSHPKLVSLSILVVRSLLVAVFWLAATASAQSFRVVYSFAGVPQDFSGRLLFQSNSVYGLVAGLYANGGIFKVDTNGGGYSVIKSFTAPVFDGAAAYTNAEGATPLAGLISDGSTLFGTTSQGGTNGKGTIFALKPDGSGFTVLKHFTGLDGKSPYAELLLTGKTLFGTTATGGIADKGTIFRINTDGGDFTVLKSLSPSEGILPLRGLVLSGDTLYGAAYQGGGSNYGTLFSLKTNGSVFKILKDFSGVDGAQPHATLVLSGNALFGTTDGAGIQSNSLAFRINADGTGYTVIKRFAPIDPLSGTNNEGAYLLEGFALAGNTLYGTAQVGGLAGNGVIFKLGTDGAGFTVLKQFPAADALFRNSDGAMPLAELSLAGGALYGTTQYGGSSGYGTIFTVDVAPRLLVNDPNFGFRTNRFGFNVTGYSNQRVVIEASANLASGTWSALQTNTLGSTPIYFTDPAWTNWPARSYRVRAY